MGGRTGSFEYIVIGGGINGVAIANQLAKQGKSVILFEKGRLGSGASSHTSKLAHGGIRYLEQGHFNLVKESISERDLLLKTYPKLVKPLPFIFPVYRHSRRPMWQVQLGMWLYDWFSMFGPMPKSKRLSASQLTEMLPTLDATDLMGGFIYYDAQMDDLALTKRLGMEAKSYGASIHEGAEVTELLYDVTGQIKRISGVRIVQHGQPGLYFSHRIINATGAWSNHVLELDSDTPLVKVAPTKGVHIVIDVPISDHAVILTAPQDGRVFFVMPYHTQTLVGTTDTLYTGSPDQVDATDEDIEYLLTAVRHYFPQLSISRASIVSTYSGLRPLIAPKATTSASQISRDFVISYSQNGLWTLLGGKYTTHRLMASKLLTVIESKMRR